MASFRRALALRPVQSEKREITFTNLIQDAGTADIQIDVIEAVDAGNVNLDKEVINGARISWVFFEINFSANNVTTSKVVHWKIQKIPSGLTGISNANVYNANDKKFIFKRGMEMLPINGSSSQTKRIFAVRIPKRYRAFQEEDKLVIRYRCTDTTPINVCGVAIYKVQT